MTQSPATPAKATRLDHFGLNAANFFLAELTGVILPFLSDFLKQQHWNYSLIGVTVSMAGIGMLVFQIPAGVISDKVWRRRIMLAAASILLGACYGILPHMIKHPLIVDGLLLVAGMASAFFVPLLAALALSLVGHKDFDKTFGTNQSWNHAGNIAASIATLICVKIFGIATVFYVVGVLSFLASVCLFLITRKHLNLDLSKEHSAAGGSSRAKASHFHPKGLMGAMREQLQTPSVQVLIISVILFNIANAPGMATVALYLKQLGSNDDAVAWAIVIGQAAMVPVAYLAARFCSTHGRKPVMFIAFAALAVRLALYPLTTSPNLILAIMIINGIDAGIYGVAIALICGDLTKGKEGFNTLLGIMQLTIAVGGVCGPMMQGFITQNMGFPITFFTFAVIAAAGGLFFLFKMPETGNNANNSENIEAKPALAI